MTCVSVEQAAQNALQVYLQAEADKAFGANGEGKCVVSPRWPAPDSGLPHRAISIIPAGARQDMHVQEQDIRRADIAGDDSLKLYTWRIKACRQPIQLDIWSCYDAMRDELCALLDDVLNKGERYTLGVPNGNPTRDGVLLALDHSRGGYQGFADFTFDGPLKTDTTRGVREREYRASILGFLDVDLTVQTATARLARVLIKASLDGVGPTPPTDITFAMNTTTGEVAVTGT